MIYYKNCKNKENYDLHKVKKGINKEHNDLSYTTIDNLLPNCDLSTATKQFITYNDGLFDHTKYFHSYIQPLGCI